MMEDKQYTWTDKDTVVDHTKEVKRLWDLVIPETEKYVKKFRTNGVKWVEHRKNIGPYHILGYVGLSRIGSFDFKGDINYMGDD